MFSCTVIDNELCFRNKCTSTLFQVPIEWEVEDVTPVKGPDGKMGIPQRAIDSINKNTIGLKGPLATPIGKGHRSLNLAIRQ